MGPLSDVREAIKNSSVFVLPSYREGTPRSVLEAMAMGRAIITTDVPGCKETVKCGYNGFLVGAKSVEELAGAMEKFILSPSMAKDMGLASYKLAHDIFDVRLVNKNMLKIMS